MTYRNYQESKSIFNCWGYWYSCRFSQSKRYPSPRRNNAYLDWISDFQTHQDIN